MTCRTARKKVSLHLDNELPLHEVRELEKHLEACAACEGHARSLRCAVNLVATLPRVEGSVASDVLSRLQVETRGPGLALLFRPMFSRRPLFLPSLAYATGVVLSVLLGSFTLDESLRLSPVTLPVIRERAVLPEMGEGSLFFETVVGPDGRVSAIRVVDGDAAAGKRVCDALRKDLFEPVRLGGRPVSVSVFRLVSRMDVWSSST